MKKSYNNDLYSISFKMKKELHRKIIFGILNILAVFIAVNLILSFLIFPVRETSNSMTPDIPKKSVLFVTPVITQLHRGDVVLANKYTPSDTVAKKFFNSAVSFFTFQKRGLYYTEEQLSSTMTLRRVVGLPGDTIYMKDFMVFVKPKDEKHFLSEFELADKSYNIEIYNLPSGWDDSIGLKSGFTPVTLGPNEYFLLADNRFSSMDSRLWGIFNRRELIARSIVLYFPFNRFKIL